MGTGRQVALPKGIKKGNQGQASQRESQGQASELRVTFGMLPNCHIGVSVHSARPVGSTGNPENPVDDLATRVCFAIRWQCMCVFGESLRMVHGMICGTLDGGCGIDACH